MPENTQGNNLNQNSTPSPSESTIGNLQGNGNDIYKALMSLATAIQKNPEIFGNGRRAPTESQSNFASNSEKWKTSDRRKDDDTPEYHSKGNLLEDFEAGIKDELLDSLAGGNFKIDLASQKKDKTEDGVINNIKVKRTDIAAEIGTGFDFYTKHFKFGIEAKMSYGLLNVMDSQDLIYDSSINGLHNRMFQVSLTFE